MHGPYVTNVPCSQMERFKAMKETETRVILKFLDEFFAAERQQEEQDMLDEEVYSPSHYQSGSGMEAIDVIEEFKLNFNLGNVVKYVLRAGKKSDSACKDLRKALWYLTRESNAQEEEEDYRGRD